MILKPTNTDEIFYSITLFGRKDWYRNKASFVALLTYFLSEYILRKAQRLRNYASFSFGNIT